MHELRLHAAQWWRAALRLIYRSDCPLCQQLLTHDEDVLCTNCVASFCRLRAPLCRLCATELPAYGVQQSRCSACRRRKTFYDHAWSLFTYNDTMRELLRQVKFYKKPWLLKAFQEDIAQSMKHIAQEMVFDFITPVPLGWKRKREREFNQAAHLARLIRHAVPRSIVTSLLHKRSAVSPQSSLSRKERLVNLQNAFSLRSSSQVRNKAIMIVDDVYTTGTTANECAKVLKHNGAKFVGVFTLARVLAR